MPRDFRSGDRRGECDDDAIRIIPDDPRTGRGTAIERVVDTEALKQHGFSAVRRGDPPDYPKLPDLSMSPKLAASLEALRETRRELSAAIEELQREWDEEDD